MRITKVKYLYDLLNPILYIILATIFGLFFCADLTEGYVEMIMIAINSMVTGILSIFFILLIKQFPKQYLSYDLFFGLIPLIIFEFLLIIFVELSVFGLFSNEPINFRNSKFVVSITSFSSIIIVYGISILIKKIQK